LLLCLVATGFALLWIKGAVQDGWVEIISSWSWCFFAIVMAGTRRLLLLQLGIPISQPGRVCDRSAPSLQLWAALVESNPQLEPALKNRLNQFYSTLPNQHKPGSSIVPATSHAPDWVNLPLSVPLRRWPATASQSTTVISVHCSSIAISGQRKALTNGFGKAESGFQLKSGQLVSSLQQSQHRGQNSSWTVRAAVNSTIFASLSESSGQI